MYFNDKIAEGTDKNDTGGVHRMLVECLCGQRDYSPLEKSKEQNLSQFLNRIEKRGIDCAQFNSLLLMLNQHRVTPDFFNFLFGSDVINLEQLKKGIAKFRGFALLSFGNFRFAYRKLSRMQEKDIKKALEPFLKSSDKIESELKSRRGTAFDIRLIEKRQTHYIGYVTGTRWEKEVELLQRIVNSDCPTQYSLKREDLLRLWVEKYEIVGKQIDEAGRKAIYNTDIYLSWDHMDVYVATSMRQRWEFEETFDFLEAVFKDKSLKELNLRYFDPTQSLCENRIDKSLIEGLMLKRISCTIYMAQEVDTMGKDSELAATLAQGKPVIAYVPRIDERLYAEKLRKYPLDFFKKRFLILKAEEDTRSLTDKDEKIVSDFHEHITTYRSSQPFRLWEERENQFKKEYKFFERVCKILAKMERRSYEERAELLKKIHPLTVQVNLRTGVANGALIVRSPADCAKLLYNILTNSMHFDIITTKKNGINMTYLKEQISGCPYRVATNNENIENSFWNFYLTSE